MRGGVCEALGEIRRGNFQEAVDVADGCDGCLGVLRKKDTNLVLLRQNARKSSLDGTKRSSQDVRRSEECVEKSFCSVSTWWKRSKANIIGTAALERGVCVVVVGWGRAVEQRDVAGDSGEDASPERGQLGKSEGQECRVTWTNAGVTWFSMKNASS